MNESTIDSRVPDRRLPTPASCLRRTTLPLGLGLALTLAACGERTDPGATSENDVAAAAAEAPAAEPGIAEPPAESLLVPPPEHARYDAELSASATAQLHRLGHDRRVAGTGGSYTGQDARVFVYTTDRAFDEVHAAYAETFRRFGQAGEIETEPLDRVHPDAFETLAAEHGFPAEYVAGYRELYPSLQGRTGRSAEFTISDRSRDGGNAMPDSYHDVEIVITSPAGNLLAGDLREQTGIQYTVTTMQRTD